MSSSLSHTSVSMLPSYRILLMLLYHWCPFQPLGGLDKVENVLDCFQVRFPFVLVSVQVFAVQSSSIGPCSKPETEVSPSRSCRQLQLFPYPIPPTATEEKVPHRFRFSSTRADIRLCCINASEVMVQSTFAGP